MWQVRIGALEALAKLSADALAAHAQAVLRLLVDPEADVPLAPPRPAPPCSVPSLPIPCCPISLVLPRLIPPHTDLSSSIPSRPIPPVPILSLLHQIPVRHVQCQCRSIQSIKQPISSHPILQRPVPSHTYTTPSTTPSITARPHPSPTTTYRAVVPSLLNGNPPLLRTPQYYRCGELRMMHLPRWARRP